MRTVKYHDFLVCRICCIENLESVFRFHFGRKYEIFRKVQLVKLILNLHVLSTLFILISSGILTFYTLMLRTLGEPLLTYARLMFVHGTC